MRLCEAYIEQHVTLLRPDDKYFTPNYNIGTLLQHVLMDGSAPDSTPTEWLSDVTFAVRNCGASPCIVVLKFYLTLDNIMIRVNFLIALKQLCINYPLDKG